MKLKPKMTRINLKIVSLFTNLNMTVTMDSSDWKKNVWIFIEHRKRLFILLPL